MALRPYQGGEVHANRNVFFSLVDPVRVTLPSKRPTSHIGTLQVFQKLKKVKSNVYGEKPLVFIAVSHWVHPIWPSENITFRRGDDLDSWIFLFPHERNKQVEVEISSSHSATSLENCLRRCGANLIKVSNPISWEEREKNREDICYENDVIRLNYVRPSAQIAGFLADRSRSVAEGLVSGAAEKAAFIDQATARLSRNAGRVENRYEREDLTGFRGYAKATKEVTGAGAAITCMAVGGICKGLSMFGSTFGPSIKKGVSKLIANVTETNEIVVRDRVEDLCNVTGGMLSAAGNLMRGIEESAKIIGPSVAASIGRQISLAHGEEAGDISQDVLAAGGNLALIGYNLKGYRGQILAKGIPEPPKTKPTYEIKERFKTSR